MEVTPTSTTVAKRLLRIVRVVYYMIRKGICTKSLMVDLHLLLKRGKIAGKAIGNLIFHHNTATTTANHYNPQEREIEFSCSTTPSYPPFLFAKRNKKHRRNHDLEAAAIRKAFEILNSDVPEPSPSHGTGTDDDARSVIASPSPLPFWSYGKSPAVVRQLRITDSPFPIKEEEGDDNEHVDEQAEAFIARFYQQLRQQQERHERVHG